MQRTTCDRIWLLYLQGRLSPAQLLALCQLSADQKEDDTDPQPSAA
ncbi:MAG: hypothetical protein AAFX51_10005 [Cyanobacteria bacterium J06636_28]